MKNKEIRKILLLLAFSMPLITSASVNTIPSNGYRVNKQFNLIPTDPKANKKIVLITIDDGPSKYSKDIMATLKKHKAGAIFFINGAHVKSYPGNIEAEMKDGFPVGNHTWSHPNLSKTKEDKIKQEIDSNSKLIKEKTGSYPKFFRSPFGISTKYSRDLVKKYNMISMNWSGAAKDWEKSARDQKVFNKNVLDDIHNGEIILIHEHEWSSKNLDGLLTEIEKKGYTFADPNQIIY